MERLTRRKEDRHAYIVGCPDFEIPKIIGLIIQDVVDRLAAYEETGLEPEEIAALCEMDRRAKMADMLRLEESTGISSDRLRELAQADKGGISPCTFCRFNPPSSGDGKPCCMCPADRSTGGNEEWMSTSSGRTR